MKNWNVHLKYRLSRGGSLRDFRGVFRASGGESAARAAEIDLMRVRPSVRIEKSVVSEVRQIAEVHNGEVL